MNRRKLPYLITEESRNDPAAVEAAISEHTECFPAEIKGLLEDLADAAPGAAWLEPVYKDPTKPQGFGGPDPMWFIRSGPRS